MLWIARHFHRGATTAKAQGTATSSAAGEGQKAAVDQASRRRQFSESLESRQMLSVAVAPVSFLPAEILQNAASQTIAQGDFNNDGKLDLVGTHEQDSDVVVALNAGDGTFLPPEHFYVLNPRGAATGDFNGDGNQDFAVLSANGDTSQIILFYGNGDGTFEKPFVKIDVGFGVNAIASADLNGDGRPDLIVTTVKRVIILLNEGGGAFSKPANFGAGPGSSGELVVGDLNGDGKQDVAMVRRGTAGISILLGNGDGTLRPADFIRTGTGPRAIAIGDFNGDGIPDLAVANSDFRASALDILIGNGDGTYSESKPYVGGNFVDGIVTGDFNGDGFTDVATVSFTSDTRVYAGNGDGTFQPLRGFPSAHYGRSIVTGDYNGDGKLDLAIAVGSDIRILIANTGAVPTPPSPSSLDVTLGAGGVSSIAYKDVSGSPVTISLSGPGSSVVDLAGANLSTGGQGDQIVGGPAALTSITATGTTTASTLSITPRGKNALVNVGSISTDGSFRAVVAPKANFVGNLSVPGTVGAIAFDNVSDGAITLGAGGLPVNLSLGNVTDETLNSAQPIANLTAGQWISTAPGLSQITAPSLGQTRINSQFSADVTTSAPVGVGTFFARDIAGGTWNLAGGSANIIHTFRGGAQFSITAGSIGSLFVLNSLINSTITTTGGIGSITAGTLVNSTITVGSPTASQATLGSVTLRSYVGIPSFANSTINAQRIGRLSLGVIGFSNNGVREGISAGSIALLSGSDLMTKESFTLRNPVSLESLAARGIDTGDFVLDINA
jgi:hypothetical protein